MKNNFKNIAVGDEVWSCIYGLGTVKDISKIDLVITFENLPSYIRFDKSGRTTPNTKYRPLFWSKEEFMAYHNNITIDYRLSNVVRSDSTAAVSYMVEPKDIFKEPPKTILITESLLLNHPEFFTIDRKVITDKWFKWYGGSCPLPEGLDVSFKFRDPTYYAGPRWTENYTNMRWRQIYKSTDIVKFKVNGLKDGWGY